VAPWVLVDLAAAEHKQTMAEQSLLKCTMEMREQKRRALVETQIYFAVFPTLLGLSALDFMYNDSRGTLLMYRSMMLAYGASVHVVNIIIDMIYWS